MELSRKGICINFNNCSKADRKEIIELSFTEDFVCPECQLDLIEQQGSKPFKKLLIPGISLLVIVGIILGVYSYLNSQSNKPNKIIEPAKGVINDLNNNSKISDVRVIDTSSPSGKKTVTKEVSSEKSASVVTQKKEIKEPKPAGDTSTASELFANSLEEALQKIGDVKNPTKSREELIVKALKLFENKTINVEILKSGSIYDHMYIEKYLNRIKIQGIKNITIKEVRKTDSGLINEITLSE